MASKRVSRPPVRYTQTVQWEDDDDELAQALAESLCDECFSPYHKKQKRKKFLFFQLACACMNALYSHSFACHTFQTIMFVTSKNLKERRFLFIEILNFKVWQFFGPKIGSTGRLRVNLSFPIDRY